MWIELPKAKYFGIYAGQYFFGGWVVMLALGALHSYVGAIPALPYWACVGIVAAMNFVLHDPVQIVKVYRGD